jgi:UDP-glucuronate decarboxylase
MDRPEVMVKEFAEFFRKAGKYLFKYNGKIKYKKSLDSDYMTDNPNRRCPSIDKAKKILGFKPIINVEDGVLRYLTFIKNKF